MKMYKIINHMDEQNRMTRLPSYYIDNKPGQADSHGYSHLYCRQIYKEELDEKMGLDSLLEEKCMK